MKEFSGKTVLITGGSSGIGLELARIFTRNGANVWILARRADTNKKAVTELRQLSVTPDQVIRQIVADVTYPDQMQKAVAYMQENNQFPDIVINSAGVCHPGEFEELNLDVFHWMMDVNYFGTVNVCKAVIPEMKRRRYGAIVNISSMAGYLGLYGYSAYSPSKFAVRGFSDVLRSELKPIGINVSLVIPTDTETPQLEYEEQYKPEITRELVGTTGRLPVNSVANAIYNGIKKKKYIISPGFEASMLYFLVTTLGNLIYSVIDFMMERSQKSLQRKNKNRH